MHMIILYKKITSLQIKYSYQSILYFIYFVVLLDFRKHLVLHGKMKILQIIVTEDFKLRMLLLPTAIALPTAKFIEKQMQFFEKTVIKTLWAKKDTMRLSSFLFCQLKLVTFCFSIITVSLLKLMTASLFFASYDWDTSVSVTLTYLCYLCVDMLWLSWLDEKFQCTILFRLC